MTMASEHVTPMADWQQGYGERVYVMSCYAGGRFEHGVPYKCQ